MMKNALILFVILFVWFHPVNAQTAAPSPSPAASPPSRTQNATPQLPELAEAERLNTQALRLFNENKNDEALPLARRVLEIRERILGSDHRLVASSLGILVLWVSTSLAHLAAQL